MSDDDNELDLAHALNAVEKTGHQRFTIYIPDTDRFGNPIPKIEDWIANAMKLLLDINDGVTKLPIADGMWQEREKDEAGEERIKIPAVPERTAVVYSNLMNAAKFKREVWQIAAFLHKFGKEANQGAVMVEFFGERPDGGFRFSILEIKDYIS